MKSNFFKQTETNHMKYKSTSIWLLLFTISIFSFTLNTAHANGIRLIRLSGDNGASGTAIVVNKKGPDDFLLVTYRLKAHTRYTVFLTENPKPGLLPAQFIGEFKTNRKGFGTLTLNAEIVQAFASANQSLADDKGVADVPGAGALANGANTIALNWIRVYLADGGGNVFGSSESKFGGGIALTSDKPLP